MKRTVLVGLACLVVGGWFGHRGGTPEPAQPEVITKIQTVHEIQTVTNTVTVHSIPDTCKQVVQLGGVIDSLTGKAYGGLYGVNDLISDASVAMGLHDPARLVTAFNRTNKLGNKTRGFRQQIENTRAYMDEVYQYCLRDIEDLNNE